MGRGHFYTQLTTGSNKISFFLKFCIVGCKIAIRTSKTTFFLFLFFFLQPKPSLVLVKNVRKEVCIVRASPLPAFRCLTCAQVASDARHRLALSPHSLASQSSQLSAQGQPLYRVSAGTRVGQSQIAKLCHTGKNI